MLTTSGDYQLPGRFSRSIGNAVLWLVRWTPAPIEAWIHKRHAYYQVFTNDKTETRGTSSAKWEALHMPADLTGKSVIDIGCSEGFFCLEAAKRGATMVLGVDARLTSLICARLLALKHRAGIKFSMAVFPCVRVRRRFDYVLCLSVLHHLVSTKDIWKIVSDKKYAKDRYKLQQYLRVLHSMTDEAGSCIVEMPYEYDERADRMHVDFDLLTQCFLEAGFASARVLCQWQHAEDGTKDRVVYVGLR
jgi:cyclopropane fatty-acyl-phospholipid synthase-like methyltransferase